MINQSNRLSLHGLLLAGALIFPTARLFAQTPANPAKTDDEALMLPEFSVAASSADGSYTSGDTLSGSRTNTAVKDLPYSISSLTSEFMSDFSLFNLTDELSFISGITEIGRAHV